MRSAVELLTAARQLLLGCSEGSASRNGTSTSREEQGKEELRQGAAGGLATGWWGWQEGAQSVVLGGCEPRAVLVSGAAASPNPKFSL